VEAFDTRPVVEEQVRSLGAKFVKIDIGETGQTENGYAKALTPEQIALQQAGMAKVCAQSDVVITTAKLFGRPSPILLTREMIKGMQPGSVIVDLAVESGGNVEGIQLDVEELSHGVRIIGLANMPAKVAVHASQVYSSNLLSFITEFWNKDTGAFELNLEDEILKATVLTDGGSIIHPALLQ
jgi:H+-translocating NAD(P) transhydrogenase subunit alpha